MPEPIISTPDEVAPTTADPRFAGRFEIRDGVRRHVARGTLINAAFLIGLTGLGFLKGFLVAAFLTTEEYGFWGVLVISVGTLAWLAQTGIGAKYVQQDEEDQELAFQKAFTLQLAFNLIFTAALMALVPVVALIYGREELVLAGLVLCLMFVPTAFTAPTWVYYRQMKFLQQRLLQSVEPVVAFVLTMVLAIGGAGYWSLILGIVVGGWAAALAATIFTPYPLKLRYDRGTMRQYTSFSWPLIFYGASGLIIAQVSVLVLNWKVSLAALGAVALTTTITNFTDRVDGIVTGTLYPAICAVKDKTDLLFESFVKSNRLALMWGMPFGVGVALFAAQLVDFGIGEKWREAVPLLQAFGVMAAVNHVGFNWHAFYRARGNTRPIAVVSGITVLAFLAITVPWMLSSGLTGFTGGIAAMTAVGLTARAYYLRRLFEGFAMLPHLLRAVAPTIPAAGCILLFRVVEGAPETVWAALAELAAYLLVTVVATALIERPLLREVLGYLRTERTQDAPAAA